MNFISYPKHIIALDTYDNLSSKRRKFLMIRVLYVYFFRHFVVKGHSRFVLA